MAFFKRLFGGGKSKVKVEPMHGSGRLQTDEEQDAVRNKMESEMSAEKTRREGGVPPPPGGNP